MESDINPIISLLFYKKDKKDNSLRISKAKSISIILFFVLFLIFIISEWLEYGYMFLEDYIFLFLFSFVLIIPVYVVGWIIGYIIDRDQSTNYPNQQAYNQKYPPQNMNPKNMGPENQMKEKVNSQQVKQPKIASNEKFEKMNILDIIKKVAETPEISNVNDEYYFLKGKGNTIVPLITMHLDEYSRNAQSKAGNRNLVKLLGDINTDESLKATSELLFKESNYTLWYDEIVTEAAKTLGNTNDKKWIPTLNKALNEEYAPVLVISDAIKNITGKESNHPLVILENTKLNYKGMDAIKYLYSIKDDVNLWTDNQKAYYYFILAINTKDIKELKDKNVHKSFYAAQIYYNPKENTVGWTEFKDEAEEYNKENAKRLHEQYPLPEDMDEIYNILFGGGIDKCVKDIAESVSIFNVQSEYNYLREKGNDIIPIVSDYLDNYSKKAERQGGIKNLVKLLADINTDESLKAISELLFKESNYTLWYDEIVTEAAKTLGNTKDKKWIPTLNKALNENQAPIEEIGNAIEKITGEKSKHPLVILKYVEKHLRGMDAIRRLYAIKMDSDSWNDEYKGYYYYLLAINAEEVPKLVEANTHKAFYAANVYYMNDENASGWSELTKNKNERTHDNAKKLHEKYPIPTITEINKIVEDKEKVIKEKKANGILPLSEKKSLLVKGTPVCDVCNKTIDVNESWFVPNDVFYASEKYRKWNKEHFPFNETDAQFNKRISDMQRNDTTQGSAVCDDCVYMFENVKTTNTYSNNKTTHSNNKTTHSNNKTTHSNNKTTHSNNNTVDKSNYEYSRRFKEAWESEKYDELRLIFIEWEDYNKEIGYNLENGGCNLVFARIIIGYVIDVNHNHLYEQAALAAALLKSDRNKYTNDLTPWFEEMAVIVLKKIT